MSRQYFAPLTEEKTELEKMSATEAEEHFWVIPELVEYLLPFLDAFSISSLACVHKPTTKILQGFHSERNHKKEQASLQRSE